MMYDCVVYAMYSPILGFFFSSFFLKKGKVEIAYARAESLTWILLFILKNEGDT